MQATTEKMHDTKLVPSYRTPMLIQLGGVSDLTATGSAGTAENSGGGGVNCVLTNRAGGGC